MAVELKYLTELTARETIPITGAPAATASSYDVIHRLFNKSVTLSATSTPSIMKVAVIEVDLSSGTATVDLTSLTGTNGDSVDGSTLRVQALKFVNKVGNAGDMSISSPLNNGYDGFGAKDVFEMELLMGGEMVLFTNDNGGDIGAGNRLLDLVGNGTDTAQFVIVMG